MINPQNPALEDKNKEEEITQRRERVSELLSQGWTEKRIAKELDVSYPTIVRDVKYLKEHVYEWVDEQARIGFMFECKKCIDEIDSLKTAMYDLYYDPNTTPELKLRASKELRELLTLKIDNLGNIPVLEGVKRMVSQFSKYDDPNPYYKRS